VRDVAFYMVDTPGILERPLEQHNEIERKAFAALQSLPDIVLFLVDPSPEMVQDIEHQMKLLKDIYSEIIASRGAGLLVAVNKVDIAPEDSIKQAVEAVGSVLASAGKADLCSKEPLLISALTGEGVDKLLDALYECLRVKTPWLFAS